MAFNDRPVAQQLMNDIDNHIVTEVVVHSIALLGNSTMDILYTLKRLARKGINVISKTGGVLKPCFMERKTLWLK